MARKYSGSRGKSGSKKPFREKKPNWLRYSAKEAEQLTIKLVKAGKMPSQIGIILRDSYGIPDIKLVTKKSITKILEENKLSLKVPEDLYALIKKVTKLMKHLEAKPKDESVKRGLIITESKIHRLEKYYKRTGKLPSDWHFDKTKAKLLAG